MYVPTPFNGHEAGNEVLELLLRRDPFVTLLSVQQGQAQVSHLPVIGRRGTQGWILEGHWAAANPQAALSAGAQATALLRGPHAYVSPRWYPEPQRAVPTWNYVALHASGRIEPVDDEEALFDLVDRLSQHFEAAAETPWRLQDGHPSLRHMLRAIRGFRLHVERLEVALKLSQHHAREKTLGVLRGLEASGRSSDLELAAWMQGFGEVRLFES